MYAFVYLYSNDVSLPKSADKALLKPKWAKDNFPHINFGLALIYRNQKKSDRKGDQIDNPNKKKLGPFLRLTL